MTMDQNQGAPETRVVMRGREAAMSSSLRPRVRRPVFPGLAVVLGVSIAISGCSSPGQSQSPATGSPTGDQQSQSQDSQDQQSPSAESAESTNDETGGKDEGDEAGGGASGDAEDSSDVSEPASFEIPAIGAGSELLHLGLRDNDTLDVPPGDPGSPASWYTGSPAPGETGPSVLLGHVDDSLGEPGVFADLPDLVEGDEITIGQEDGNAATFVVTKAEQYGKDTFPTLEVYGNTADAELRLITCDGYIQTTGKYEENYVVYAELAD